MKLISLSECIDDIENAYHEKEESLRMIFKYNRFLKTYLQKSMFIGNTCIFMTPPSTRVNLISNYPLFDNSSCWEAGYDSHHDGDFIKVGRGHYNNMSGNIFNISNCDMAWLINYFEPESIRLNELGIKTYFGVGELRDHKLGELGL